MVIATLDVLDTTNITFKQGEAINTAGGFKCCSADAKSLVHMLKLARKVKFRSFVASCGVFQYLKLKSCT